MTTAAIAVHNKQVAGAKSVIRRFTLHRMFSTAVIFGMIAAIESIAQSAGIVAAYPKLAARAKVIDGLASNNALGLFYGDKHVNIVSPGGYMVYRILPIISLVLAIWSLMFITKMLRGQEENGRWELLLSGETSNPTATADTILGAGGGIIIALFINFVVLALAGHDPKLRLPVDSCLLYAVAAIAGAVIALGIGSITSQLASTRRRAVIYGLAVLIALFVLRSIGNVVNRLAWLKDLTPFGWIDKLHPFTAPDAIWLVPLGLLAVFASAGGIWLAGKRDVYDSFIADSDRAKPKFRLLDSQLGFDFRQMRNVLAGWLIASMAIAALIAAIDKTVAKSLSSSTKLTRAISNITGNRFSHFETAYLSAAGYLILIILMIMVTGGIAAIREEEASGRLDNFVGGGVSRSKWLGMRAFLLLIASVAIILLSNFIVWVLADAQGVHVRLATMLLGGLNILGPIIFILGVGLLAFGILPRFAAITMYLVIAWSFSIDIITSAVKTSKYLADTSLLHHIALVPAAAAKWSTFVAVCILGLAMAIAGLGAFNRRDLQSE